MGQNHGGSPGFSFRAIGLTRQGCSGGPLFQRTVKMPPLGGTSLEDLLSRANVDSGEIETIS